MLKKIESRIFSFLGYAQSFKVDFIATMQQKIETMGIIKAIHFLLSAYYLYYAVRFRKAKSLIGGPALEG